MRVLQHAKQKTILKPTPIPTIPEKCWWLQAFQKTSRIKHQITLKWHHQFGIAEENPRVRGKNMQTKTSLNTKMQFDAFQNLILKPALLKNQRKRSPTSPPLPCHGSTNVAFGKPAFCKTSSNSPGRSEAEHLAFGNPSFLFLLFYQVTCFLLFFCFLELPLFVCLFSGWFWSLGFFFRFFFAFGVFEDVWRSLLALLACWKPAVPTSSMWSVLHDFEVKVQPAKTKDFMQHSTPQKKRWTPKIVWNNQSNIMKPHPSKRNTSYCHPIHPLYYTEKKTRFPSDGPGQSPLLAKPRRPVPHVGSSAAFL